VSLSITIGQGGRLEGRSWVEDIFVTGKANRSLWRNTSESVSPGPTSNPIQQDSFRAIDGVMSSDQVVLYRNPATVVLPGDS
jgi:hypothetical protein